MNDEQDVIPYHRPYPLSFKDKLEINQKVDEILTSGQLSNGKYCRLLEETIKRLYNVDYVIATNNCTMGLYLCLQYKYNSFTSPLFMPNFTWLNPYLMFNDSYRIEFQDIDQETWLVKDLPKTKHFLQFPTHTFGSVFESDNDHENYNCIHDAAHSLGSKINQFGEALVFSLAPTKLITSCEGGLVLTNQKYLADFVSFRRDKGARMPEINAIIGLQTLKYLSDVLKWKKKVYIYYAENIPGQFQRIPLNSNYNTIGFLNTEHLIIPSHIETKQYYNPLFDIELLPNSYYVWKNIVVLPSYYNCPYKQIVDDIKEVNGL